MSVVFQDFNWQTGVKTVVHDLDNKVVISKEYDRQPFIEAAAEMRARSAGQSWGEMRHIGFIPPAELATMLRQDGTLDQARAMRFLRENPLLCTFDKALKT